MQRRGRASITGQDWHEDFIGPDDCGVNVLARSRGGVEGGLAPGVSDDLIFLVVVDGDGGVVLGPIEGVKMIVRRFVVGKVDWGGVGDFIVENVPDDALGVIALPLDLDFLFFTGGVEAADEERCESRGAQLKRAVSRAGGREGR